MAEYGLKDIPRSEFGAGFAIQAKDIHANLIIDRPQAGRTVATTGATTIAIQAPRAGTIGGFSLTPLNALAADNTNYLTFAVSNATQTKTLTAAVDANTTKLTGGVALVANERHPLTVTATAADLVVAAGDVILLTCTATGTLANTVYIQFTAGFVGS